MGFLKNVVDLFNQPAQPANTSSPYRSNYSPQPLPSSFSFNVAGINYRMENVMKLATPMKKWDMTKEQILQKYGNKKIYRYYFTSEPVQLIPEPNNPQDPNAIKVIINNMHVGYVPQDDCSNVKALLNAGGYTINAQFSGGEYKIISLNGDVFTDTERLSIRIYFDKE